jgi:hypothetical protein
MDPSIHKQNSNLANMTMMFYMEPFYCSQMGIVEYKASVLLIMALCRCRVILFDEQRVESSS